jgi:putative sigma-54 modulation protein
MQIRIRVKGLPGAAKLRHLASQKLDIVLSRYSHAIQEADVQLGDINGPDRGGVDKLCRIVLRMKDSTIVVIEALSANIAEAISHAADRIHQRVSRQNTALLAGA